MGGPFLAAVVALSSVSAQPGAAGDVYRIALRDRIHGIPASMFVLTTTPIRMPTGLRANGQWFKQFKGMPDELLRVLRDPPAAAEHFASGSFPDGTKFVAEPAVRRLFQTATKNPWPVFKREMKAEGWIAFSDVVFTADGLDALVYYEGRCEGLCGEGVYAWLHRDSGEKKWSIKRRVMKWVS